MKLKNAFISLLLVLLSSCGGQNSPVASNDGTLKTTSAGSDSAALRSTSVKVSLMESLAALYPQGKASAESAVKALAQNPAALRMTSPAPQPGYQTSTSNNSRFAPNATFADYQPVARIQNTTLEGSYFFSIYDAEIENALAANPDWILEGAAFWASLATGDGLSPVHRFRNLQNGSYLYTIYEAEKASIISNYARTFTYEGVAWYARQTQSVGWLPLYRFRNLINGTYVFTAYEEEKNAILLAYFEYFALEGVAYYVLVGDPPADPVVTTIAPLAATIGLSTKFFVTGTNLPLDANLSFPNASCLPPVQNTTTGFTQTCTPTGFVGVNNVNVKGGGSTPTSIGTKQVMLLAQTIEPAYTGNLPDTGITNTQCYGAGSDNLISCTSPAAIALNPKQDGMIGRDVTSPLAADGHLGFSYSDVPNSGGGVYAKTECVKDNITGLIWEGKTIGTGPRGNAREYTNFDSTDQKIDHFDGSGYVNVTQAEIDAVTNGQGYKNYVNSIALCGYSDWRMPEIGELDGLLDVTNSPSAHFDSVWFPDTFRSFWSNNKNTYSQNFSTFGFVVRNTVASIGIQERNVFEGIRLVRGTTFTGTSRYSFINQGTEVVDNKTKLIWKRCAEGMAWNGSICVGITEVLTHELALVQANFQTGWRLPNRKELVSLAETGTADTIHSALGVQLDAGYWSSSPENFQPNEVWSVSLRGGVNLGYRSNGATVLLVRNAP